MSRVKTLLLAVIVVVGILFPTTTWASPGITVSITDATLPAGASGSVVLSISGATQPVSCIDVDITYDPAVVEVTGASGSDFDSLVSNIENSHTHLVAYVTSPTGLTGTIKVADITLKRLAGEGALTLDVITLKDDDGTPILFSVVNGLVSGTAIGLTASIGEVTLASGATGSVAVTISGVSSDRPVSSTTIDVKYDSALVEVIDASGSDFSSLVDNIENNLGYTRLVAYVTSETGLTGTIKVADITLKRLGGEGALTLDVVTLKDDDGKSIPFTVVDGRVIADDILPTVVSTSPANGATGVAITTRVRATFSEAMDEGTLSFTVGGVAGTVTYTGTTATFTPSANLRYSRSYTASISASDLAGNPMVAPYSCSFTTRAEPVDVGPVGVGAPAPPAGTTDVSGKVTAVGRFTRSVTATSEDELCTLTIPKDTVGLTEELEPLDEIIMVIMDDPPPSPEDANIVGLAYDFGPDGATFEPAITLEYTYDPDDIPEWVAEEDLVIARWDENVWNEDTGEWGAWVELPCTVDTATHTITALVSHFTTFAVIARRPVPPPPAPAPAPAAFSLSNLTVQPIEVQPNEPVTITVSVTNTGGTEGSYSVVLMINGVKEAEKRVTVAAADSQLVSFCVSKEEAGSYTVVVDGLRASFTVVAPPPPAPPPPPPAPPPVKPPFNWVLVGIMAGVVVLTVLVFFFVIRPILKGSKSR